MRLSGMTALLSVATTLFVILPSGVPLAAAEGSTAICSLAENPCAEPYSPAPTHIEAEAVAPVILTSQGGIKCEVSTLSGDLTNESGTFIQIALTSMTFSGCTLQKKETCHISSMSLGQLSLVGLKAYAGDATLGGTVLRVVCGPTSVIDCKYGGEPVLHVLSTTAEEKATFSIPPETPLEAEGGICPEASTWVSAEYRVESLEAMYVSNSEEVTSLCAAEESPCETPNVYPAGSGTHFEAVASEVEVLTAKFSVVCENVKLLGEFADNLAEPLKIDITAAAFEECLVFGAISCTVTTGLGQLEILTLSEKLGEAIFNHMIVQLHCSIVVDCTYALDGEESPPFHVLSEKGTLWLTTSETILERVIGACPTLTRWDAEFQVSAPGITYLSS